MVTSSDDAIAARGLGFLYPGSVRALDAVDLSVAPGELVAVIGPNGSGKSTLLKCFAGLLQASAGVVEVGGQTITALSPRERARRLAMVPQFLPALPDVTVLHFVLGGRYAWFRRWRGASADDLAIARNALVAADMTGVEARAMSELSGGQRQRVLVARALAQQAAMLLIDEPTNALDPEHQIQVLSLIARLVEAGSGAILVTHDLSLAGQFATRVVVLSEGRVVAEGKPVEVMRPEVLAPVYGSRLYYGRWRREDGTSVPFVIPHRDASIRGSDGGSTGSGVVEGEDGPHG